MKVQQPDGNVVIVGGFAWPKPNVDFSTLTSRPFIWPLSYEFAAEVVFLSATDVSGFSWKYRYFVPDYDTKLFLYFNFNVPSFTPGQPYFGGEFYNYFVRNIYPWEKVPD